MLIERKFHKLNYENNSFYVNQKKIFNSEIATSFEKYIIEEVFLFAFEMAFGTGKHRAYRSGGSYNRTPTEIFLDAFQGKLAEFAVYNKLTKKQISYPCLDVWDKGKWDVGDFIMDGKNVSVKSTRNYSNLLLLEENDFNQNGEYIPNSNITPSVYDYIILVRLNFNFRDVQNLKYLLKNNYESKYSLMSLVREYKICYDIPGFITISDFRKIIKEKFLIPKGSILNGKTKIDANNYYIQAGDLRPISEL